VLQATCRRWPVTSDRHICTRWSAKQECDGPYETLRDATSMYAVYTGHTPYSMHPPPPFSRLVPCVYIRDMSILQATGKQPSVAELCFLAHLRGFGSIFAEPGWRLGRHVGLAPRTRSRHAVVYTVAKVRAAVPTSLDNLKT